MKKFKFKFSGFVFFLLSVVLIVCFISLALNVYNLIHYIKTPLFKVLPYILYIVITLFLIAVVLGIMLFSSYSLKKGNLYVRFGFFVSKTKVSDVIGITHFKKSDKLVIYFKDQTFSVVVIAKEKYDDFVLILRELNKSIFFSSQIDGEDLAN